MLLCFFFFNLPLVLDQLLEKLCWEEWKCPGFPAGLGFSGWLLAFSLIFLQAEAPGAEILTPLSPFCVLPLPFPAFSCLFPLLIHLYPLPWKFLSTKKTPKGSFGSSFWDLFLTKLKEKSLEKVNKRLFMT